MSSAPRPCSGSRSAATPGSTAAAASAWPFPPPTREVTCDACRQTTTKFTTKFGPDGGTLTTCSVCETPRHSDFSGHGGGWFSGDGLTLDHVQDETDAPVRVTSARQLREAEARYKFRHHAANYDEANWDKPPQQASGSIQDNVKWLYPELAERMLKDPDIKAEMEQDRSKFMKKLV